MNFRKGKKQRDEVSPIINQKVISIGEKVKFWEEQDKLNKILIPRVIKTHSQIESILSKYVELSGTVQELIFTVERLQSKNNEEQKRLKEVRDKLFASVSVLEAELKESAAKSEPKKQDSLIPYVALAVALISLFMQLFRG